MRENPVLELAIFDCDGVLVDSEFLACGVVGEVLAEHGFATSGEDIVSRFAGISDREMFPRLEQEHGRPISDALRHQVAEATRHALATRLQPIPGIHEALRSLRLPKCVASGSEGKRVRLSLGRTGLSEHFDSNIFTREQVERGKPAPDLFLLAATQMSTSPERCVVIEDSEPGVAAGVAAGMRVLGFTGASHCGPDRGAKLQAAGAERILDSMNQLLPLLQELGMPTT
jgi:HAD superfamily hydrolase (TIGR01509 family)